VDNGSRVVDLSWPVNNWSRVVWCWCGMGNNNWGCVIDWGRVVHNRCWVVDWCSGMVDWYFDGWDMSWGMHSSALLFTSIRVVDILRSSMGLAGNNSGMRSMWLVD